MLHSYRSSCTLPRKLFHAFLTLLLISSLFLGLTPTPVARAILPPPDGLSPCDETTYPDQFPPVGVPELRWQAVEGATQYEVEVNSAIGFNGTVLVKKQTPYTAFTPAENRNFANGTYYWRVRAMDKSSVWSPYSTICSITQNWNLAPTLQSPPDGSEIEFFTYPTFSWQPVQGAAKYHLDLARDPSFATLVSGYPIQTYVTTFTPLVRLGNATYYWRVTPLDRYGHVGQTSESWSFTLNYARAPQLLVPNDNPNGDPSLAEPRTPTFRWTAVEGADHYELEIATDANFTNRLSNYAPFSTRNTTHTPQRGFTNDTSPIGGYYWRVRAVDRHDNKGPYSQTYRFLLGWSVGDRRPQLLTPPNAIVNVNCPALYTWTPVPGAALYEIQIAKDPGMMGALRDTTVNTAYDGGTCTGPNEVIYWRVRAIGESGSGSLPVRGPVGDWSEIFSYSNTPASLPSPPPQIYPQYYYAPPVTNSTYSTVVAPVPTFIWDRSLYTHTVYNLYTLQVAENQNFSPLVWSITTQNLSATPTNRHPETNGWRPDPNVTYYWRVSDGRPNPADPYGLLWGDIWLARFDPDAAPRITGTVPLLIRPTYKTETNGKTYGWESVDVFPNLEWTGVISATRYQVQISRDETFTTVLLDTVTDYTNFTPQINYAARDHLYGDYFWRVKALTDEGDLGEWSQTWRFVISHQPQIKEGRVDGINDLPPHSLLALAPAGDALPDYDLRDLYVAIGQNHWFFSFSAPLTPPIPITTLLTAQQEPSATMPISYFLFIDTDHADDSGATTDPFDLGFTFSRYHRPEYAVTLFYNGLNLTAAHSRLYAWDGSRWTYQPLSFYGSAAAFDPIAGYVEVSIRKTALGSPASIAVQLAGVNPITNEIQDTVPSDDQPFHNFVTDALAPTQVLPFNNSPNDQTDLVNMPRYFAWNRLAEAVNYPFRIGRSFDVASSLLETAMSSGTNITTNFHYAPSTRGPYPDNDTYYWQESMMYKLGGVSVAGPYGQVSQFTLQSYVPANLSPADRSTVFQTPTFDWDPVEWAASYELQVANNAMFASPALALTTEFDTYTPATELLDGVWYWRVRIRKSTTVVGPWSVTQVFTKTSPIVTGLETVGGGGVNRTPTFIWSPIITPTLEPTLSPSAYKILISDNPGFNTTYDSQVVEGTSYTPYATGSHGTYADGTYYWKVAMAVGTTGNTGPYSPVMTVTKQYPQVEPRYPRPGGSVGSPPTFSWWPVAGAGSYKFQIATDPLFNNLINQGTTDNTTYTPATKLNIGAYYWRVAMVDGNNVQGPWVASLVFLDPSPPGSWRDFRPTGWITTTQVSASVVVSDFASGLDINSGLYRLSNDTGVSFSPWYSATVSGFSGVTIPQTVLAENFFPGPDSATQNQIQFQVSDRAGNPGTSPTYTLKVDTTPPGEWQAAFASGWYTRSRTVSLGALVRDATSGLNSASGEYRYSTNGGVSFSPWSYASVSGAVGMTTTQWITATNVAFGFDSGTAHSIQFRVRDVAGLSSESPAYPVRIDTTAPAGWGNLTPAGWADSRQPTVQVEVSDFGSGVDPGAARYRYSTDGGVTFSAWQAATVTGAESSPTRTLRADAVPFNQDSATQNRIQFQVADVAGNPGLSPVYTIRVDTASPGEWQAPFATQWYTLGQTATLGALVRDAASGLDVASGEYRYSTDAGVSYSSWLSATVGGVSGLTTPQWITATAVSFGFDSGTAHWLQFRVRDVAGLSSESPAYPVRIDTTAPAGWGNLTPAGWADSRQPTVQVEVSDFGSGVDPGAARYRYSTDGGVTFSAWQAATVTGAESSPTRTLRADAVPFNQDSATQNRIQFQVADVAGNPGLSPVYTIRIDRVEPGGWVAMNLPAWFLGRTVTVSVQVSDTVAGLDVTSGQWRASSDGGISYGPWQAASVSGDSGVTTPQQITATITFAQDSRDQNRLQFRVADVAGNVSTSSEVIVPIDSIPPQSHLSAPAISNQPSFAVTWGASDATSGVATCDLQYRVDSGNWKNWLFGTTLTTTIFGPTNPVTVQNHSVYEFRVRASDQAGNVETYRSLPDATTRVELPYYLHLPLILRGFSGGW